MKLGFLSGSVLSGRSSFGAVGACSFIELPYTKNREIDIWTFSFNVLCALLKRLELPSL